MKSVSGKSLCKMVEQYGWILKRITGSHHIFLPEGNLTYKRGEIRWVNLDPTMGVEAQKIRACLIVQNDIMNQHGLLTIVMPFPTRK